LLGCGYKKDRTKSPEKKIRKRQKLANSTILEIPNMPELYKSMSPQTSQNIIDLQPVRVPTINEDIMNETNVSDVSQDGKI